MGKERGKILPGLDANVFSLAVYKGKLYGGAEVSGKVYRYDGGTTWTDIGRLEPNLYVSSLAATSFMAGHRVQAGYIQLDKKNAKRRRYGKGNVSDRGD